MEKYKYEGKNKESLIDNVCKDLNLTDKDLYIKEYEEKGGLFQGKKYYLEAVKVSDAAEYGKNILSETLRGFGTNSQIELKIRDNQINYEIISDNNSILIGKRGHLLNALLNFTKQAIYNMIDIYPNVTLDIGNYKEKQNYFLEKNVKKLAREVTLTKVDIKLDPMNSYERRLVHSALTGFKYIETISEGEEPNRCVVIKYKNNKES